MSEGNCEYYPSLVLKVNGIPLSVWLLCLPHSIWSRTLYLHLQLSFGNGAINLAMNSRFEAWVHTDTWTCQTIRQAPCCFSRLPGFPMPSMLGFFLGFVCLLASLESGRAEIGFLYSPASISFQFSCLASQAPEVTA